MRMRLLSIACMIALASLVGTTADAATLRVAPISLDLTNGTNASTVRVWNDDREPLNVQVRIFKWAREKGKDVFEPTRDVVVSPPMATLAPGTENLIRIVRVSKQAITGREDYRLVVDQLPNKKKGKPGSINILVRHVIPVRFE